MNAKRFLILALGSSMLAAPACLLAQQNQESVVEAAKKARAEKKNAPKPKIVIDDDNVGSITGTINIVGEAPAPPPDQTKATAETAQKTSGEKPPVQAEDYWRGKFTAAHKKLENDQRELDITQREFNLKQEQFYTDPTAQLKQQYSRQDLNDAKAKIDDLTARVAQDKQDIANLEDDLRKAGGDPGWATPSQSQQQPQTQQSLGPTQQ